MISPHWYIRMVWQDTFDYLIITDISPDCNGWVTIFLIGPSPASFSLNFCLFKQTIQFLQQINVKNVHPVYGAGI